MKQNNIENKIGKTISEICAESGEQYFRDLEYESAKELSLKKGCIISAGVTIGRDTVIDDWTHMEVGGVVRWSNDN